MTMQLDLFAAAIAQQPTPPAPAPGPGLDNAGARAFAERKIGVWLKRAAENRERGGAGAEHRAHGLEAAAGHVARAAVGDDALEQLKISLAACQPYDHPTYGMRFNDGPIMREVRARLQAKIDALEGR